MVFAAQSWHALAPVRPWNLPAVQAVQLVWDPSP
jgi:hypothetical protein